MKTNPFDTMKKYTRLALLNRKLKKLKKDRDSISKFYENGNVCVSCCMEYDRINTDVYLTNKKINFLNQGKSFLGDFFGVDTTELKTKL